MSKIVALCLLACCLVLGDAPAEARQSMSFTPGARTRISRSFHHAPRYRHHGWSRPARRAPVKRRPAARADDESPATARPGAGFTMQDGVLTYPAPARFQPKNLKRLP